MTPRATFAGLVSLACHDMRTPLATVHGFTRTLAKAGLPDPASRYVEMIEAASAELAELVSELAVAARIEAGTYAPVLSEVDSLDLARTAAELLGEERVAVSGAGATVRVDEKAVRRGIAALVQSALRHGGFDEVAVSVDGPSVSLAPVTPASAAVLTGDEHRDLGAAVAVRVVRALGGGVELAGTELRLRLPQ